MRDFGKQLAVAPWRDAPGIPFGQREQGFGITEIEASHDPATDATCVEVTMLS